MHQTPLLVQIGATTVDTEQEQPMDTSPGGDRGNNCRCGARAPNRHPPGAARAVMWTRSLSWCSKGTNYWYGAGGCTRSLSWCSKGHQLLVRGRRAHQIPVPVHLRANILVIRYAMPSTNSCYGGGGHTTPHTVAQLVIRGLIIRLGSTKTPMLWLSWRFET